MPQNSFSHCLGLLTGCQVITFHHFIFLLLHQLILVEAKLIDLVHLLVSADVDAAQVILHLLLGLEPLVAVLDLTLEFVFLDDLQVMHVDLDGCLEG